MGLVGEALRLLVPAAQRRQRRFPRPVESEMVGASAALGEVPVVAQRRVGLVDLAALELRHELPQQAVQLPRPVTG
jgi:hypothetical protein